MTPTSYWEPDPEPSNEPSHNPTNNTRSTAPPTRLTPPNTEVTTAPSGDPPLDGHSLHPSYYQSSANSNAAAVATAGKPPPTEGNECIDPPPYTVNASGHPPLPQLPPPPTELATQPWSVDAIVDRYMDGCGSLILENIDVSSLDDAALLGSLKTKKSCLSGVGFPVRAHKSDV